MNLKRLILFLSFVVLIGCDTDEGNPTPCKRLITVSDALPIQLWPASKDTYNETEVCSIEPVCFCQSFNCDDEIAIQFSESTPDKLYSLVVQDDSGATLYSQQLIRRYIYETLEALENFNNPTFLGGVITPWDNFTGGFGAGNNFAWAAGPKAQALAGGAGAPTFTSLFGQLRSGKWPPGNYTISITGTNSSTGGSAPTDLNAAIYVSDSPNTSAIQPTQSGTNNFVVGATGTVRTLTFTLDNAYSYLMIRFSKSGVDAGYTLNMNLTDVHITSAPQEAFTKSVFSGSFVPSEHGICNEKIVVKILDPSYSDYSAGTVYNTGETVFYNGAEWIALKDGLIDDTPGVEIDKWALTGNLYAKLRSDCLDIKTAHTCTNLIPYSNSDDFAGIEYYGGSPDVSFQIRLKSVFFEEQFPDEFEGIDLSNSQMVQLTSTVKRKKQLDLDFMPFYMHKKIQLILAHDHVVIDGENWEKLDAYQIEQGNKRYPLRKASVLLSDKDFIKRNVL